MATTQDPLAQHQPVGAYGHISRSSGIAPASGCIWPQLKILWHSTSQWVHMATSQDRERGGSVVECRTPEREVGGSIPAAAMLCPWARHFTPRKYWLITQEAVAPSRHDWKIVYWDVKPQHKQTNISRSSGTAPASGCIWPQLKILWHSTSQ